MVTCCKVTGTNIPTQKTHLVFFMCGQLRRAVMRQESMCLPQKSRRNDCRVCVCCTVFDTTHPIGVVVLWVCVGGFSVEGTPGPVPIPVAKLDCADGTAIVGLWESKTPPTHQKLNKEKIV